MAVGTEAHAEARLQIRGKSQDFFCLSSPRRWRDIQGERERASGRAGGRVWPAMMEWVCAPRQMCVSVTDAFRVSGAQRVADTWRTDISPSRRCSGTYFVSINVRSTTARAGEGGKKGRKRKDEQRR